MAHNTNKSKKNTDTSEELRRLHRAHGVLGNRIGAAAETRVTRAFRWETPWIYGVRDATKEEDASGIDRFILTDVGPIPLQVKTSKSGKRQFQKERGDKIPVIVVEGNESDPQLRKKIVRTIGPYRKKLISERSRQ